MIGEPHLLGYIVGLIGFGLLDIEEELVGEKHIRLEYLHAVEASSYQRAESY